MKTRTMMAAIAMAAVLALAFCAVSYEETDAEPTSNRVTYNANGAEGIAPDAVDISSLETTEVTVASAEGLTKEGYDFNAWKDPVSGNYYVPGDVIDVSDSAVKAAGIELVAQWMEIKGTGEGEGMTMTYYEYEGINFINFKFDYVDVNKYLYFKVVGPAPSETAKTKGPIVPSTVKDVDMDDGLEPGTYAVTVATHKSFSEDKIIYTGTLFVGDLYDVEFAVAKVADAKITEENEAYVNYIPANVSEALMKVVEGKTYVYDKDEKSLTVDGNAIVLEDIVNPLYTASFRGWCVVEDDEYVELDDGVRTVIADLAFFAVYNIAYDFKTLTTEIIIDNDTGIAIDFTPGEITNIDPANEVPYGATVTLGTGEDEGKLVIGTSAIEEKIYGGEDPMLSQTPVDDDPYFVVTPIAWYVNGVEIEDPSDITITEDSVIQFEYKVELRMYEVKFAALDHTGEGYTATEGNEVQVWDESEGAYVAIITSGVGENDAVEVPYKSILVIDGAVVKIMDPNFKTILAMYRYVTAAADAYDYTASWVTGAEWSEDHYDPEGDAVNNGDLVEEGMTIQALFAVADKTEVTLVAYIFGADGEVVTHVVDAQDVETFALAYNSKFNANEDAILKITNSDVETSYKYTFYVMDVNDYEAPDTSAEDPFAQYGGADTEHVLMVSPGMYKVTGILSDSAIVIKAELATSEENLNEFFVKSISGNEITVVLESKEDGQFTSDDELIIKASYSYTLGSKTIYGSSDNLNVTQTEGGNDMDLTVGSYHEVLNAAASNYTIIAAQALFGEAYTLYTFADL